jgi:chemotaxis protein methyltransferase CheR
LLSDEPPQTGFQIIFLRNNLLTYYQGALQSAALDRILQCLAPGGFLITGAHENVCPRGRLLLVPTGSASVFQLPPASYGNPFPLDGQGQQ